MLIDILYCGVCHSDLHQARDEWGGALFPMVPGHEIVGRVRKVGDRVKKLAPGDLAGVGCVVDSCLACDPCDDWLARWLLSFGSDAEAIEPAQLRDLVRTHAEHVASRYAEPATVPS